ncbi:MAG: DUF3078 domain-containing protein [Pedobacter sp.]|nr:MAG: DUF3078 domain-containing protein [Pedobacter sp.]
MKSFNICLLLLLLTTSASLLAQEVDTIPIDTKGMEIKLKRSPLPTRSGSLIFKPVQIAPITINEKVNYWKTTTAIGIDLNQGAFSKNWKAGGVNSMALGGMINYRAAYAKDSYSYTSDLRLEYGKIKNKEQLPKKTKDRLFWDHKAGLQLSKSWFFFGSVTLETQFDRGYVYYRDGENKERDQLISKFFSPAYLTESIGFEYKPVAYFSTRLGTGTAKQTFVTDMDALIHADTSRNHKVTKNEFYGVPTDKNFRNELAFQITSTFGEKQIAKNLFLYARYNMFIPYDRPLVHVDHRLDVTLKAKINRFMNVQLNGVGIFDKDSDNEVQASQNLSMGIAFSLPR